jgi:ribonuclease HI
MTHVFLAYSGAPRGAGAYAAIWQDKYGSRQQLTGFSNDTTANRALLEAVANVVERFNGEPVTIHTSSAYLVDNVQWLDDWAARDWQTTKSGSPLQNADHWQRIHASQSYPVTRWVREPRNHPMIVQAKALAAEKLQEALGSLGNAA